MKRSGIDTKLHITRDLVLFSFGILGIVHETVVNNTDRPTLLALFAAMVGLPVFLRLDSKDTSKGGSDE